jgi:hypothetical protein
MIEHEKLKYFFLVKGRDNSINLCIDYDNPRELDELFVIEHGK